MGTRLPNTHTSYLGTPLHLTFGEQILLYASLSYSVSICSAGKLRTTCPIIMFLIPTIIICMSMPSLAS